MIGDHTATNKQSSSEWTYLKKKTKKFIQALNTCPTKPYNALALYTSMLLPSIGYSLPTTSLYNDQFQYLE
eukprot:1102920-Ditylum_brightwellii.AAC.1